MIETHESADMLSERAARRALIAAGRGHEVTVDRASHAPSPSDEIDLAIAEWNAGRADEAVERLSSVVANSQDDRAAHALGWMLLQRGETVRARELARRIVGHDSAEPRHVALLAATELAGGDASRAELAATRLTTLVPREAPPHELLGYAAASRARWGAAAAHFDRALELDEYAHDLLLRRAEVQERRSHIREAFDDLLLAAKYEESLLATHVATLVERTLRPGHSVLAVTIFWGLAGVPGLTANLIHLMGVVSMFVAAVIALIWHRRRLGRVPPEAMATYRKIRIVVHVFVALMSSFVVLVLLSVVVGLVSPRGITSGLVGALITLTTVLVTVICFAAPDLWRALRGIPVKRAMPLAF